MHSADDTLSGPVAIVAARRKILSIWIWSAGLSASGSETLRLAAFAAAGEAKGNSQMRHLAVRGLRPLNFGGGRAKDSCTGVRGRGQATGKAAMTRDYCVMPVVGTRPFAKGR